jgi:integrase
MLENTPSLNPVIKQAFLFSCYTGLRFSDVAGLTWDKLQSDSNGGTYLNFVQEKTTKREYLPIPNKAINNLPNRADAADTDKVFTLSSVGYVNLQLRQWAFQAGIKKYIHFHVARHTYATLLLTKEVPIETVSKNLGHAEIRTTQIYAKVINQAQREAVNKLDEI